MTGMVGGMARTSVPQLPAPDKQLSPFTGYTRQHWEAIADQLLAVTWHWQSPQGARLDLPGPPSGSGVRSDGLEGYARTFLIAAFRVAGAEGDDPHGWMQKYAEGLIAGTAHPGAEDPESWPKIEDYDVFGQPMVESASIALGLRMTRPWLWDKLSADQQDRAASWLKQALVSVPAPNNWYLFPYTVAGFLESLGRADEDTALVRRRALRLLENWYSGDGWYTDGDGGAYDYYNGWALHLYPLLDHLLSQREAGTALTSQQSAYGRRMHRHLQDLGHFFGSNGAPVYFGRSMTYRFAAAAAVGLGAITGDTPLTPGTSRRILSGAVKYFIDAGALDQHGLLSLGWHGPHQATLQGYSGPASPYWAAKAFVALLAPADHPLWTAVEEPSPAETADHVVPISAPGFLLQSTAKDGIVRLHNHGNDHLRAINAEAGSKPDPLYSRWAYSTHAGPTSAANQADNTFTVAWRGAKGERTRVHPMGVGAVGGSGWAASWHRPSFPGRAASYPGLRVTSMVVVRGTLEVRIHVVEGAPAGASAQASGWACRTEDGTEDGTDLRSTLVPLAGWTHSAQKVAPAGTAFHQVAEVPVLHAELNADGRTVLVSLAELRRVPAEESSQQEHAQEIRDSEMLRDSIDALRVTESEVSFAWAGKTQHVRVDVETKTVAITGQENP